MAQGRGRERQARRKQARAEELWLEPDTRPKKRCYLCRRECVLTPIRWQYRRQKPFVCPWCRGRNIKFIWACVMLVEAMASQPCPRAEVKKHEPDTCRTLQCTAGRVAKMRKLVKPR